MKVWRTMGCLVALTIFLVPASAQNLQEVIPVHSPAYRLLDDILLEAGRLPTSSVRPFTKAQFQLALALVDRSLLSNQGLLSLQKLENLLAPKSLYNEKGQFSFNAGISVGLEGYLKTNSKHTERYKDYGNRLSLLAIPISLDFMDFLSLAVDFDAREEYFAVNEDSFGFDAMNIPGNIGWLDINQPLYTNLSLGSDHFNLSIGRNQLTIGPGAFSKLLISDNAHYLEYLTLKTFWDAFTFTALMVNLDPGLLNDGITGNGVADEVLDTAHNEIAVRNFFLHRTEVSLFDQRLNIAISEGYMIGGANPELKHFNPLMVFHNYYDWSHASSMFSADISFNPWKYFNIYGQFVFNQLTTAYESDSYGVDDMPNARGFMAGLQYRMPLGEGYIGAVGEFWYTDPWLYIRETPLTSYAWRRTVLSNLRGAGAPIVISAPLGFKYGPDAEVFAFNVSYDWKDLLSAQLDFAYVMKGEQSIDFFSLESSDYKGAAAVQRQTPSGISENTLYFILSAAFTPVDWLEINGSLGVYFISNQGHVPGVQSFDLQGSLGVQFVLGRKSYQNR